MKVIDWSTIFPSKSSSARLAGQLGCAVSTVKRARKLAGINWDSLGEMTDAALGLKLKIPALTVRAERLRRGIPAYGRLIYRLDWDELLTGETDSAIARRIGCSHSTVANARAIHGDGSNSFVEQLARIAAIDWDAIDLGARSDVEISRELGVSKAAVYVRRKSRNIPAMGEQARQEADVLLKKNRLLGVKSDAHIADKLGISRTRVGEFRRAKGITSQLGEVPNNGHKGIDWDIQPLGEMTDIDLSKRLDVGTTAVSNQRYKRGIPAFRATQGYTPPKKRDVNWDKQPLGEIPDTQLARKLGVTASAISHQRYKRDIPPAKR